MNIKSAFLNGKLEKEVYVEQSKGYVRKDQECKVLKLKKSIIRFETGTKSFEQ